MLSKMSTDFNGKVFYKGQPAMSLSVKMKVAALLHKVHLQVFVLEENGILVDQAWMVQISLVEEVQ